MPSPISRRTLTKGAAWAAPAIIATSAIPAYAASSKPEYELVASWGSTDNYTQTSGCNTGKAYYDNFSFYMTQSKNGAPAGFAVRAWDDVSPTTTATLDHFTIKAAFPVGPIQSITVTGGAYTVSGPVRQTINGVASDVYTFTGTKTSSTIAQGATTPSWPNSLLTTNVTVITSTCYTIMPNYYAQFSESFTTANGYSETYTSPWIDSPIS